MATLILTWCIIRTGLPLVFFPFKIFVRYRNFKLGKWVGHIHVRVLSCKISIPSLNFKLVYVKLVVSRSMEAQEQNEHLLDWDSVVFCWLGLRCILLLYDKFRTRYNQLLRIKVVCFWIHQCLYSKRIISFSVYLGSVVLL